MTLPNLKLGSCGPASPERAARLFTPLPAKPPDKPPVKGKPPIDPPVKRYKRK